MKKHILHLATTLLLGMGLFAASCGDDKTKEDPGTPFEPNFPAKVTPTVEAGATYTLEIEPNGQWALEFTNTTAETASWFWIQDGSQKVYSLRGSAGKRTITIATKEEQDFNNPHSCELTLSIKGKNGKESKQVIAAITIDKFERQISVYACQLDEEGDFIFNPDPDGTGLSYLYEEVPSTEFELRWPVGRSGYSMPIMIKGNFDWSVRGSKPEWISDMKVASGKNGEQVEIRLEANLKTLPLNGAEESINLGDANQTFPIKVKVPNSRDFFRVDNFIQESVFNHEGHFYVASNGTYSEGPSAGNVSSAKDLKIICFQYLAQMGGGYWDYESVNWIEVKDKFDPEIGVVQSRRIEVYTKPNPVDPRKGIVVGLPASVAAKVAEWQLTDENGIKSEYQKYIITTIEQLGHPGPISAELSTNITNLEEVGTAFSKVSKNDPEFGSLINAPWAYNSPHVYKAIYTTGWSNEDWKLKFSEEAAAEIVFDNTLIYEDTSGNFDFVEQTGSFWLQYNAASAANRCQIQMGTPAASKKTGLIRFCNKNWQTVAMVYCILDKDAKLSDKGVEFVYPTVVQNATVSELTSGNYYDQYKNLGCRIYHLTYTGQANTAQLKTPTFSSFERANEADTWLSIEGDASSLQINMNTEEAKEGVLIFKNAGGSAVFVLVCTHKVAQ